MALIRDIVPPAPDARRSKIKHVQYKVQAVHEATKLSTLAQQRPGKRVKSFDVVRPATLRNGHLPPVERPTRTQHTEEPEAAPVVQPIAIPKQKKKKGWRRWHDFAQYPLVGALALGVAYSSTVGQIVIVIFAVLCLLFGVSSRYSFGTALLLLASIPLFQVLDETGVAQNAAIYAYELLVVGTFLALIELWKDRKNVTGIVN